MLQEKAPLLVKNLLNLFNNVNFVNKSNIKDYFTKYMDMYTLNSNNNNNNLLIDDCKVTLLNKELDNKNLILTTSGLTLIKSLMDLVFHLVFFDNITYEVFINIFHIFDYYIFAAVHMFVDKSLLAKLFEEVNPLR